MSNGGGPSVVHQLRHGPIHVVGRLPDSSNYAFVVAVGPTRESESAVGPAPGSEGAVGPTRESESAVGLAPGADGDSDSPAFVPPASLDAGAFTGVVPGSIVAVYKPGDGERPLWDFPEGLFRREVASYELSAALGWDLVPETVQRADAPAGPGSLQRFVDADFAVHYFHLVADQSFHDVLMRLAAFDVVANSADRKAGHVLVDSAGSVWAIDNGLTFHEEPKLRTVVWDFAGDDLPPAVVEGLESLTAAGATLLEPIAPYLDPSEIAAVVRRAGALLRVGSFPEIPPGSRPYPWPLV